MNSESSYEEILQQRYDFLHEVKSVFGLSKINEKNIKHWITNREKRKAKASEDNEICLSFDKNSIHKPAKIENDITKAIKQTF